jgi:pyrroline-5-carboxylate reductase
MTHTFLFIGAGRMAEAMIKGLLHTSNKDTKIIASNQRDSNRLEKLQSLYGIETTTNWIGKVASSDVIILAMPPEAHDVVLEQLSLVINGQLVITVAAGIGIKRLQRSLPAGTSVAWIMPNTAAEIGQSMSLFTHEETLSSLHKELLQKLLDSIGESEFLTEEKIYQLTAVTGSAPAFLYEFALSLEKTAMKYGVSEETARRLVSQMVYGSSHMLKNGTSPSELRDAVTTPGGATAAGLKVLEDGGYSLLLEQAVEATNQRAHELGQEKGEERSMSLRYAPQGSANRTL